MKKFLLLLFITSNHILCQVKCDPNTYKNMEEALSKIDSVIGNTVIIFEPTRDGKSSNNIVKKIVADGLKTGLVKTNNTLINLSQGDTLTIKTITITATTNGYHDSDSNHCKLEAVDIGAIDGVSLRHYNKSKKNSKKSGRKKQRIKSLWKRPEYLFLYIKVETLHSEMNKINTIRESFGPDMNKKFDTESGWNDINRRKVVKKHKNHFHFSFR